jgi:hypothetical protein
VAYLVFSQEPDGLPDTERLATHASRFFGSKLERLEAGAAWVRVRLSSARPPFDAELILRVRDVTRDDISDAKGAEARGRAAGMSALAEKCPRLWEIGPAQGSAPSEDAYLALAGICASVALGPVLPPDRSTLFGVRGAMERLALSTSKRPIPAAE